MRQGRLLGTVASLRVQREPLKQGPAGQRAYDPSHIVEVGAVRVDRDGAVGLAEGGEEVLDVHNARHPRTRDRRGDRGLSLMSDQDYVWLRERFGEHLTDGVAGETITLRGGEPLRGQDLSAGVLIETRDAVVPLTNVRVAAPCVEFTRYVLRRAPGSPVDEPVRATLEELDHGARGFVGVATVDAVVSLGDRVFLAHE